MHYDKSYIIYSVIINYIITTLIKFVISFFSLEVQDLLHCPVPEGLIQKLTRVILYIILIKNKLSRNTRFTQKCM